MQVSQQGALHWTDASQDAIVLGFLIESRGEFVAGPVLCDKLDVPRAELLKRIDSLRARGYQIEASGGRGYRLGELPDGLGEAQLAPLLTTAEIGRSIHVYPELPSTNDEAHTLAEAGALHGEVVVAEQQTKGRGRKTRSWLAPKGKGLTLSVILRPAIPAQRAPELTLVAAVAVCEAARELGAPARIKWPNDVECRGRKLAGLLTELRAEGDRIRHAVLGIGLNVSVEAEDLPEELRPRATSLLLETGERHPRPVICAALFAHLEEWLDVHETEGFDAIRDRFRDLSSTLGRRVRVEAENGGFEGEAVDLAPDGALLVAPDGARSVAPDGARSADHGEGGLRRVVAADIEHLRPLG